MMNETIVRYIGSGLSLVPVGPDKRPLMAWKQWQERKPTATEIDGWLFPVAAIGGAVSGGLICIDFDDKGSQFAAWGALVKVQIPDITIRMLAQHTPSGGYHVVFRCPGIECRNQKLAMRPGKTGEMDKDGKTALRVVVLIETRAEGGYFLIDPSPGYKTICGNFTAIPTYSPEEAQILLSCAGELDQTPETKQAGTVASSPNTMTNGVSPFDDFDSKNDPIAMLEGIGWKVAHKAGEKYLMRRPGKADGISATWNHKPGRFYVFSTSTEYFRENHYYKPSAVYTAIHHNNDFNAAAKALYAEGYGTRRTEQKPVDVDDVPTTITKTFTDFEKSIFEFYKKPFRQGLELGVKGFDDLLRFEKGYLNIISGIPSHGKSEFLDFVAIQLVKKYSWNFVVFSPENYPLELHFNKLSEKWHGCGLHGKGEHLIAEAIESLHPRFDFIDATEEELTIDTILNATVSVSNKKKVDALIIDPWNEIESNRPKDKSETDFIGECLRRLRKFARKKQICVFLVAHPTKMYRPKGSAEYPIPTLYDISSSAHFYNKADNGVIVHRSFTENRVSVFVKKVKFRQFGELGQCDFEYVKDGGLYKEIPVSRK